MAQEFQNLGPIYITEEKYEAAKTAGTLEAGREYRIVDAMIDGDVIPIDDSTIKLNDDGELYAAGGSSESDIFPITASSVTETTFAVDKTPSELQEALEAGKLPVLFIQTTESFCHTLALSQYKSTYISASFEETIEGRNMLFQINKVGEEDVYEGSISEKTCNTVSVSDTGTAIEEVSYITIDGVEKKIAGGGDSSSILVVTITGNVADKTNTEIYNAYLQGQDVILKYNDYIFHIVTCGSTYAYFDASYTISSSGSRVPPFLKENVSCNITNDVFSFRGAYATPVFPEPVGSSQTAGNVYVLKCTVDPDDYSLNYEWVLEA